MCPKVRARSVTWVHVGVVGHLGAHMQLTPRFGQFDLALAFGQFFFLLGSALVVAVSAAHAQHVMR